MEMGKKEKLTELNFENSWYLTMNDISDQVLAKAALDDQFKTQVIDAVRMVTGKTLTLQEIARIISTMEPGHQAILLALDELRKNLSP
jgi:hypothetical protein